jgi:hypothetical protein
MKSLTQGKARVIPKKDSSKNRGSGKKRKGILPQKSIMTPGTLTGPAD